MILNPTHYTPFFAMTAAQVATVQVALDSGVSIIDPGFTHLFYLYITGCLWRRGVV